MPRLPTLYKNRIALADWLEITALEDSDRTSSAGDLEQELAKPVRKEVTRVGLAFEAMEQIAERVTIVGPAYPFSLVDGREIVLKGDTNVFVPYIFCLYLSFFGWRQTKGAKINPWLLFEELAVIAAGEYLAGEVLRFGSRFLTQRASFADAVESAAKSIGEGGGFRRQSTLNRQDDHVDLIAWKNFPDNRPSKVIMFGQCAAGDDWAGKVSEMQPGPFWAHWMAEQSISEHLRSFYVPHWIPKEKWDYCARYAGIIFDRARIAHWCGRSRESVGSDPRYLEWCNAQAPIA